MIVIWKIFKVLRLLAALARVVTPILQDPDSVDLKFGRRKDDLL